MTVGVSTSIIINCFSYNHRLFKSNSIQKINIEQCKATATSASKFQCYTEPSIRYSQCGMIDFIFFKFPSTKFFPFFSSRQMQSNIMSSSSESLPPPPAYLLDSTGRTSPGKVGETVKALTELNHMPASPSVLRRAVAQMNSSPPQVNLVAICQYSTGNLYTKRDVYK